MAKIKKKPLLASLIVTQANELVESRYNLTLGEQRLIFTMIATLLTRRHTYNEKELINKIYSNFQSIFLNRGSVERFIMTIKRDDFDYNERQKHSGWTNPSNHHRKQACK